jgi:hypothetical protein
LQSYSKIQPKKLQLQGIIFIQKKLKMIHSENIFSLGDEYLKEEQLKNLLKEVADLGGVEIKIQTKEIKKVEQVVEGICDLVEVIGMQWKKKEIKSTKNEKTVVVYQIPDIFQVKISSQKGWQKSF